MFLNAMQLKSLISYDFIKEPSVQFGLIKICIESKFLSFEKPEHFEPWNQALQASYNAINTID